MNKNNTSVDDDCATITNIGYANVVHIDSGDASNLFLAHSLKGKKVCVKVFQKPYEMAWLERIEREYGILQRLNHDNVVGVEPPGIMQIGEKRALSMEYIEGSSFRSVLNNKKVSERDLIDVISSACRGLAYVHDEGIVHRDLHSGNIMLRGNSIENVVLVDFSTARDYSLDELRAHAAYHTFRPIGAMSHCAPEKWLRPHDAKPASDIFSLGVIMYVALTGKNPYWDSTSYINLFNKILRGQHAVIVDINPQVTPELVQLVEEMIQPDVLRRISTARETLGRCTEIRPKLKTGAPT